MNRIDTFIAAALEEFVTDTARLLDAARQQKPLDRDEIAFWRAQSNAFVKAQTYFLNGTRLTATPSGYTVPSASRPGCLIHRCYRVGGIWHCTCEARVFCWHAATIAAYERGYELAGLEDDTDAGEEPPPPIALDETPAQLGSRLAVARARLAA